MVNAEVARIFRSIAQILQIKDDNRFRIAAYERAAQNIESLSEPLETIKDENRLGDIPGIGKDLSSKISEFIDSGSIRYYDELKLTIPAGLLDLLEVSSIGPKTAKLLFEKLGIGDVPGLEKAIKSGKLKGLPGIKQKSIENMLKGIELYFRRRQRMTLAQAEEVAAEFISRLSRCGGVKQICVAGSLRRRTETVGDIDILVASGHPAKVIDAFVRIGQVKDILAKGSTKASVRTKDGVQLDCRVVGKSMFGAALLYFTGSKLFNIRLRKLSLSRGCKLNEYGIFKGNKLLASKTEEQMLKALKLQYIEPELREDNGEIELAKKGLLPKLIESKDIKGDLHVHSVWSDGSNTVEELAGGARRFGYSYIAVTDHSQSLRIANGLSVQDLENKRKEIEGLNKRLKGIRVLYGTEADIDPEGNIDYDDGVLRDFDIVIAAIHSGFKQDRGKLTRRIIEACKNKYVHIIAHPTGRLWGVRDSYELDFREVLKAASDTNTALEINSFPSRLDLNDLHSRQAKQAGVRLAINTDSHSVDQLPGIRFGISVARRGWVEASGVINTLSCDQLLKIIKK